MGTCGLTGDMAEQYETNLEALTMAPGDEILKMTDVEGLTEAIGGLKNVKIIVRLQAGMRGYLVRIRLRIARERFMNQILKTPQIG